MAEHIAYTTRDGIAEITLDDGKVNAMHRAFFDGLNAALDRAAGDGSRALVVTGRPGYLSAGLNIKLLPTLPPDELRPTLVGFGQTLLRLWTYELPTVAAASGHAVAGGALLAFACDRRFLTDGPFRVQMNETAIGLPLPTWALAICQAAIPRRWHTEALLHAHAYTPAESLERGMVDDVVAPDALLGRAREAAQQLAALDRPAYAASKRRLRARDVAWAEQVLVEEMTGLPIRR